MNFRNGIAAVIAGAGILALSACNSSQAGTALPIPGQPTATTSAPTTSAPTSDQNSDQTSDPADHGATASSSTESPTEEPTSDDPTSDDPATADPSSAPSGAVDGATEHWVTGMCTDMTALLRTVYSTPKADEDSPVSDFREAYVTYYQAIAESATTALGDAKGATPPNVPNGAKIHQAITRYLIGLQDIATEGAKLIANENTAADISADIHQISKEIGDLSTKDSGLGNLNSPDLAAAIKANPACKDMSSGS